MLRVDLIKHHLNKLNLLDKSLFSNGVVTKSIPVDLDKLTPTELMGTKVAFPSDEESVDGTYLIYLSPRFSRGGQRYQLKNLKTGNFIPNTIKVKESSLENYIYEEQSSDTTTTDFFDTESPDIDNVERAIDRNRKTPLQFKRPDEDIQEYKKRFIIDYDNTLNDINGALNSIDPEFVRKQWVRSAKEKEANEKRNTLEAFYSSIFEKITSLNSCLSGNTDTVKSILNFKAIRKSANLSNCETLQKSLETLFADNEYLSERVKELKIVENCNLSTEQLTEFLDNMRYIKENITTAEESSERENLELQQNITYAALLHLLGDGVNDSQLADFYTNKSRLLNTMRVRVSKQDSAAVAAVMSFVPRIVKPEKLEPEETLLLVSDARRMISTIGTMLELREEQKLKDQLRVNDPIKPKNQPAIIISRFLAPMLGLDDNTMPLTASEKLPVHLQENEDNEKMNILNGIEQIPGLEDFSLAELYEDSFIFYSRDSRATAIMQTIADNIAKNFKCAKTPIGSTTHTNDDACAELKAAVIMSLSHTKNEIYNPTGTSTPKGEMFESLAFLEIFQKMIAAGLDVNSLRYNKKTGMSAFTDYLKCTSKESRHSLRPLDDVKTTLSGQNNGQLGTVSTKLLDLINSNIEDKGKTLTEQDKLKLGLMYLPKTAEYKNLSDNERETLFSMIYATETFEDIVDQQQNAAISDSISEKPIAGHRQKAKASQLYNQELKSANSSLLKNKNEDSDSCPELYEDVSHKDPKDYDFTTPEEAEFSRKELFSYAVNPEALLRGNYQKNSVAVIGFSKLKEVGGYTGGFGDVAIMRASGAIMNPETGEISGKNLEFSIDVVEGKLEPNATVNFNAFGRFSGTAASALSIFQPLIKDATRRPLQVNLVKAEGYRDKFNLIDNIETGSYGILIDQVDFTSRNATLSQNFMGQIERHSADSIAGASPSPIKYFYGSIPSRSPLESKMFFADPNFVKFAPKSSAQKNRIPVENLEKLAAARTEEEFLSLVGLGVVDTSSPENQQMIGVQEAVRTFLQLRNELTQEDLEEVEHDKSEINFIKAIFEKPFFYYKKPLASEPVDIKEIELKTGEYGVAEEILKIMKYFRQNRTAEDRKRISFFLRRHGYTDRNMPRRIRDQFVTILSQTPYSTDPKDDSNIYIQRLVDAHKSMQDVFRSTYQQQIDEKQSYIVGSHSRLVSRRNPRVEAAGKAFLNAYLAVNKQLEAFTI